MKFSKFSELVNRILSNNHSHRRDMDVTIVVHSPGSIGSTPSVEVQSIHAGFDWDSGKVLIFPSQPLTTLTPEQITDITDSVRKGQSWHAYQEYKKHQEQLEKLSIELEAAEKRIAELEARAFNPAILDVIAERQRQQSVEGWTPAHDDKHDNNEMAFAASCYAFHSAAASWDFEDDGTPYDIHQAPKNWPWDSRWWKPTSPRRDLVKAGALIIAEIERIDRATGIRIKGE